MPGLCLYFVELCFIRCTSKFLVTISLVVIDDNTRETFRLDAEVNGFTKNCTNGKYE